MQFNEYLQIANSRMFGSIVTRELAIAANHITNVDFFDESLKNLSPKNLPIICLEDDEGEKDISQSMSLQLQYSRVFTKALGLIAQPDSVTNFKKLDMGIIDLDAHSPDVILAELSIIFQYSLLESYEFSNYEKKLRDGSIYEIVEQKFSLKDIKKRGVEKLVEGCIKDKLRNYCSLSVKKRLSNLKKIGMDIQELEKEIDKYEKLSNRRNEIIHEVKYTPPDIFEAIQYFQTCRDIAKLIGATFNDEDAKNYQYYIVEFFPEDKETT